jgi:hypothetical protein
VQSFKNALIVSINFFDVVFSFYLVILFLNVVLYFSNISFVLGSIWFENSDIIREYFFANAQFSFFTSPNEVFVLFVKLFSEMPLFLFVIMFVLLVSLVCSVFICTVFI